MQLRVSLKFTDNKKRKWKEIEIREREREEYFKIQFIKL